MYISTNKKDLNNYRFVGLVNINIFNKVVYPKTILVIGNWFKDFDPDKSLEILEEEKDRLVNLRLKLESLLDIHSLHLDEVTINEISELCLEIRSFEIKFDHNFGIDDLIKAGLTKRQGVFGVMEVANIYRNTLQLLHNLVTRHDFETEIKKND